MGVARNMKQALVSVAAKGRGTACRVTRVTLARGRGRRCFGPESLDVQHRRGSVAVVESVGRVSRCHRHPWMAPSDAWPRMQQQKFDWPAWSARARRRSKRRGTRTWDC
jgi:hypothetical protein